MPFVDLSKEALENILQNARERDDMDTAILAEQCLKQKKAIDDLECFVEDLIDELNLDMNLGDSSLTPGDDGE